MSTITFDTLKFSDLATKSDLRESEMRIVEWVVAMAIAQMVFIVGLVLRMPQG